MIVTPFVIMLQQENENMNDLEGVRMKQQAAYQAPQVLEHREIRFETAQSWNRGRGNRDHPGTGNDGILYPLEPWPGPQNGNGGGNGGGNGNRRGNR